MVGLVPPDVEGGALITVAAGLLGAEVCGVLVKHGIILREESSLATLSPDRIAEKVETAELHETNIVDLKRHLTEYKQNRAKKNIPG